jgi:hypothetical protein
MIMEFEVGKQYSAKNMVDTLGVYTFKTPDKVFTCHAVIDGDAYSRDVVWRKGEGYHGVQLQGWLVAMQTELNNGTVVLVEE